MIRLKRSEFKIASSLRYENILGLSLRALINKRIKPYKSGYNRAHALAEEKICK